MDSCPSAVPAGAREAGDSKRPFGRLYSEPRSLALDPGHEGRPLFHEFASALEQVRPPKPGQTCGAGLSARSSIGERPCRRTRQRGTGRVLADAPANG